MHGPDGRDYQNRVTFDEIVAPERIVYRHGGGDDVEPVQFKQTVTFEDLGNGKTRLTWHGTFPSAEERARVIKEYGADKGLMQTMARLAEYRGGEGESRWSAARTRRHGLRQRAQGVAQGVGADAGEQPLGFGMRLLPQRKGLGEQARGRRR